MHKFQPRIHLVDIGSGVQVDLKSLLDDEDKTKTFSYPETAFMAVTAYQNQLVSSILAN